MRLSIQAEFGIARKPDQRSKNKNIVICCDGTGNQFGDANSNVVKLYTALKIDNKQVGYYHPGVGTMGDPSARNFIGSIWSRLAGLAFGRGFRTNVLDAYRFLMDTYDDGDSVYLFGFSRGAYAVRALAGLLDGYGLLCRGNEGHIPYAWRLYLNQLKHRSRRSINAGDAWAAAFKETFSHENFMIDFVGIWDTVSSVGWISAPLRLYNIAQNKTIRRVRHAVAIDERRCFYSDNLYGDELPHQDIQQVWFTGAHSDVGGAYPQVASGLSNITLEWMIREAGEHGAHFVQDRINLVLGRSANSHPACRELYVQPTSYQMHDELEGEFKPLWWILEYLPHRYYDKDDGKEQRRIPQGSRRELPCGALVHHSVYERLHDNTFNYCPKNLPKETLTELFYRAGEKPLYRYTPKHTVKSNNFNRLAKLFVFYYDLAVVVLLLLVWMLLKIWHVMHH